MTLDNNKEDIVTPWSSVGWLTYRRTYARTQEDGTLEDWPDTVNRVVDASKNLPVPLNEEDAEYLRDTMLKLKGTVAGRFLWQMGTKTVERLGLASLMNCAFTVVDNLEAFTWTFDNLMLGSGVGYNIQREYVYKLPPVREEFETPTRKDDASADFIVSDTREGWVKLLDYTIRAAFKPEDKHTFTYSTQLIRGKGAPIKGFGGVASGPEDLVWGIEQIGNVIEQRRGKQLRPIDCLDILNIIGKIVVAGNVRRSAQIAIGDADDLQFLRAKNWALGNIPSWRQMSNNSVVCNDINLLPDEIWNGYDGSGEPYGLINLKLSQNVGRIGDTKYKDPLVRGYNPCLTYETPLLTSKGYVQIGSVVGESVDIWNGREWSEVKPFSTGVNEIVRVHLTDGSHIDCTPYHKFLTINGFNNDKVLRVEAENLVPGMKLQKWEMPVFNHRITRDIPLDAYSQGFYSGDGNLDYDYSYLYEPKYCCEPWLIGSCVDDSTEGRKRWKHGKMLPKSYVPVNEDLTYKLLWLAGLLDSDGTVTSDKNGNGLQVVSVDEAFLQQVRLMLTTMGCRPKIVSANGAGWRSMPDGRGGKKDYFCQETKRLLIGNQDTYELLKLGLACHRLKLHANPPQRDARQYIRVKSVEWLGIEEETFCVTEPILNQMTVNGIVTGNCAEQSLNAWETCCLAEIFLPNIESKEELFKVASTLYKVCKGALLLPCHQKATEEVVHKNLRMGIGVTGYMECTEEQKSWLSDVYLQLRELDNEYSKQHGINKSIKLTTQKPSGTLSLLPGVTPGCHPAFARYMIRRIRIAADHDLVQVCRDRGYDIEYVRNFDGSEDRGTVVVSFPFRHSDNAVMASDMSAIDQLEVVRRLQKEWSDNSVSCTVYYRKEELPLIRDYLKKYYNKNFKSLSFLLHSGHGFVQAPLQEITKEEYEALVARTVPITSGAVSLDFDADAECVGGVCPVR